MTEFTKEYIHKVRVSSYLIEPPAGIVVGECLDEIERLQVRVQELEAYIDDFTPDSMQIAKKTIISKLEGKVNVASDLLESISLWFYKNVGNPDPFWACQFESACKLFENSEEDNNETSNL